MISRLNPVVIRCDVEGGYHGNDPKDEVNCFCQQPPRRQGLHQIDYCKGKTDVDNTLRHNAHKTPDNVELKCNETRAQNCNRRIPPFTHTSILYNEPAAFVTFHRFPGGWLIIIFYFIHPRSL
jgi:hypothetical protein